jgi:hypothetical protein
MAMLEAAAGVCARLNPASSFSDKILTVSCHVSLLEGLHGISDYSICWVALKNVQLMTSCVLTQ